MTTVEEVKRELESIAGLDKLINSKIRQLENQTRNLGKVGNIKAMSFDGIKSSPTNSTSDPTGEAVVRVETLKDEINEKIDELVDKKMGIEKKVSKLPYQYQAVINLKYFEELTWFEVSIKMDYEEKQCRRLRDEAVKMLADIENGRHVTVD